MLELCSLSRAQSPPIPLEDAIREALDHNLSLVAERFNLPVAEARLITAQLRPNPVFSVGADHLDILGTGYNLQNAAGPAEISLRTDFLLERGAKRAGRIAVAQDNRALVDLQLLNTVRNLVLDVQTVFTEILLARENLSLAQDNLKAFGDIVNVNRIRVKSGDLSEVELLRTELAQLQFENAVRQAGLRQSTARNRLQSLLGRDRSAPLVDVSGKMRKDIQPVDREKLEQSALDARPDLLGLRRDQARSLSELRLQLAQGKVDYTVGSEYRRQQGLGGRGNSVGLFFSASLPVYNRNQGEIERARQEQRQIEARLKALTAAIRTEVETAYLQHATARTTLDRIENTMLAKARDVRRIMEYSYRRGEASLVEFLDAQRAYNETIQAYNEAQAEFARSLYQLDAVSGKR